MPNFADTLIMGGPIVWLLFLFSIVALTITLLKLWQFWQLRQNSKATADQALAKLEEGKRSQAIILVNGQRSLRANILAQALRVFDSHSLSLDEAKNEIMRRARHAICDLGHNLRALEVIASLAPLLGLLGTVLGMIEAFQAMEAAGSQVNPSILSGGIWKALLTTAIGVAVAIPVSIIHCWFERKIEVYASNIQNDLERLFTLEVQKTCNQRPSEVEINA